MAGNWWDAYPVAQQGGGIAPNPIKVRGAELDNQGQVLTNAHTAQQTQLDRERFDLDRRKFAAEQEKAAREDAARQAALHPDMAPVRAEAEQKIAKLNGLIDRSKNNWFATGAGTNWPLLGKDSPGTNAYAQQKDVDTVTASGAISKIMEMAAANGGKNPLTPMSNSDAQLVGNSIANLDIGQPDGQFQNNAREYRKVYQRALRAGGGVDTTNLRGPDAQRAYDGGRADLERQIARYTPQQQARARQFYDANPGVQSLRQRAAGVARQQSGGMSHDDAALLAKYGVR